MAGVFRRPFHRVPRRRVVHGVAAVVVPQAPGLHRRRHPALVRAAVLRPRVARRMVASFVVAGRGRITPLVPIAKILMERHRIILRERIARERAPVVPTVPLPAAVGSTPFPPKPIFARVLPEIRGRRPAIVPTIPAVPGVNSTPFVTRPSFRPRIFIRPPTLVVVFSVVTPPTVTVCTSGAWSSTIVFVACDSYRLEIDGGATDNAKVSITMELEES